MKRLLLLALLAACGKESAKPAPAPVTVTGTRTRTARRTLTGSCARTTTPGGALDRPALPHRRPQRRDVREGPPII
jgi:uncharacterized lipoprotein YbaY